MESFMGMLASMSNKTLHVTPTNGPVSELYGMGHVSAHGGKKLPEWKIKRGVSKICDTLSPTKQRLQAKLEAKRAQQ